MDFENLLILEYDGFSKNVEQFFSQMNSSEAFREYFINNPTAVMKTTLFPNAPDTTDYEINRGNRLLFEILSNKEFMKWAEEFHTNLVKEMGSKNKQEFQEYVAKLDRTKLYEELLEGMKKHLDNNLLASLFTRASVAKRPPLEVQGTWAVAETFAVVIAVVAVHILVTQVDFTPIVLHQELLDRIDLQRLSDLMGSKMISHAEEIQSNKNRI